MPMNNQVDVGSRSPAYDRMYKKWDLIRDLVGGTIAMREAGTKWLAIEPQEEYRAYENRLGRSFLYGAFRDTVQKLAAKPFSKPVVINADLPDQLEGLQWDCDMHGRDLTQFGRLLFEDSMKWGLTHVLIDFPQTGGGLSLSEERISGVRPYFVHISPLDMIGWKTYKGSDGMEKVSEIRFRERRVEYGEGYREGEYEYVRVIGEDYWQLWRQGEKSGDYVLVEEGSHSFGEVPISTFYINQVGTFQADPPLEDLAWLNLAHWQSLSDQRNILRFARVGILFASGLSEEEIEGGVTIGPTNMISSTNPEAKMTYVEHSGKAIAAGQADLETLEARMEVLGLQPLMQSTGNTTATARAMDEARTHSNIQAWIRGLENNLVECFSIAATWVNAQLPDDFAVDIFNDFGISLSTTEDIKALIDMKKSKMISAETFLGEVRRRGLLSDDIEIDEELNNLQNDVSLSFPPDLIPQEDD